MNKQAVTLLAVAASVIFSGKRAHAGSDWTRYITCDDPKNPGSLILWANRDQTGKISFQATVTGASAVALLLSNREQAGRASYDVYGADTLQISNGFVNCGDQCSEGIALFGDGRGTDGILTWSPGENRSPNPEKWHFIVPGLPGQYDWYNGAKWWDFTGCSFALGTNSGSPFPSGK